MKKCQKLKFDGVVLVGMSISFLPKPALKTTISYVDSSHPGVYYGGAELIGNSFLSGNTKKMLQELTESIENDVASLLGEIDNDSIGLGSWAEEVTDEELEQL